MSPELYGFSAKHEVPKQLRPNYMTDPTIALNPRLTLLPTPRIETKP